MPLPPQLATGPLEAHQVGRGVLPTLHYLPDFISPAEEARLLEQVHASRAKWVQLSGRRLQNHGGMVHAKGLVPAPLPAWLQALSARVTQQLPSLFPPDAPPNHVLVNAYAPGCGIMPHQDGPLYHPAVVILSCGSPAVLRFWAKADEGGTGGAPPVASLFAAPRSLLVFQDDAYTACLHGIDEVMQEVLDSSVVNAAAASGLVQGEQQQQQQHGGSCQCSTGSSAREAAGCQAPSSDQSSGGTAPQSCPSGSQPDSVVPRQGERVSFTFRRVLKVHKALGFLGRP